MKKSKALRLAGFAGALCASGALLGTSISGTGAYFTDSANGAINASTGHVKVNTSDTTLNFTNLLPGEFKTQHVDYAANGTGAEDIWLVLPANSPLNNADGSTALGRYGHFAVSAPDGSFTSYNLRTNPSTQPKASDSCGVDANGHGGSDQQATSTNNADPSSYVPYCPAPTAILLSHGLNAGQGGTVNITFGFTKVLKSGQDGPLAPITSYKIVATQAGVRPDDVNNG